MTDIHLICCHPPTRIHTALQLDVLGFTLSSEAEIAVLVDSMACPVGDLMSQTRQPHYWIVVTDNPCPDYWENLWDKGIAALLTGQWTAQDIARAVCQVQRGERFRHTSQPLSSVSFLPRYVSSLTPGERRVLARVACGESNKEIAKILSIGECSVKAVVGRISAKLELSGRLQLSFYYLGLWHLLPKPYRPAIDPQNLRSEPSVVLEAAD